VAAAGDPVRRHEIRQESKRNNDFAGSYVRDLTREVIRREDRTSNLEQTLEAYLYRLVMETTADLDSDTGLENHLKAAIKRQ
jgi:hypothetical protein